MSIAIPEPSLPAGLPDPASLAHMAREFFAALPAVNAPLPITGVQAPVNVAPSGSVLSSPAGLGPNVPGTPIPQGQLPGSHLIPATPAHVLNLAHRAPVLIPHAESGNRVPDLLLSTAPAYEPRLGSAVLGVSPMQATPPVGAAASSPDLEAFSRLPFALPKESARDSSTSGVSLWSVPAVEPRFYFADTQPATAEARQAQAHHGNHQGAHPAFDVHAVRRDFPILQERVNGKPLVWLDNAATTQKPQAVMDRLTYFYQHENSNIHRAAHELAARATDAYEQARERVREFIHAPDVNEVIFVRGTTEAINLVAKSWGWQHVGEGDEIIVSHLEHHANIVPWQQLAAAKGAKLRVIPVDDDGQVRLDEYTRLLNPRTRIVSVTQVSNALGTVVPVKDIVALAKRVGAVTLVDGAQSVSHMQVDVQDIGCDFFVFSGHKIFGPTGIGALWGKREVLEDMPPWQGGGNMIADVTFEKTVFQPLPNTFEAGTGNIADAVGLGEALAYVQRLGLPNIARYEHELLCHGMAALREIKGLRLIGTAPDKASVMSFVLNNYTTQEVGEALNREGIAVRTGHHCAQPILRRFGLETTVRPSLAFYNTHEEVDLLVRTVHKLAQARY